MSTYQRAQNLNKTGVTCRKGQQTTRHRPATLMEQPHPAAIFQRGEVKPVSLSAAELMQLQRTIGNRAVGQLLSRIKDEEETHPPSTSSLVDLGVNSLNGTQISSPVVQGKAEAGDKTGGKKSKAKAPKWTRETDRRPRLLDGRKASYDIIFEHVLPTPPKGVTQLWQVIEVERHILSDKCKSETEHHFVVDIVDIDKRNKIKDQWAWLYRQDPCFAVERREAKIGYDDQKSNYDQQTNLKVTKRLAKELLGKMAAPKGTYSSTYTFVKKKNCPDCPKLEKLQEKHGAPSGEVLKISGLGEWKS